MTIAFQLAVFALIATSSILLISVPVVFASRIPSVFWVWKSVDFQQRESNDMLGILYDNHPRLKRFLMPESWIHSSKGSNEL